ncbi:YHS domain-containing (seleno)protein [Paracoccus spongiarum]|uniref:YHS domain-containing (Seleno)protein n=1 Tax=Paracoccus spongiarum TaxID=3064387 RepID=A0ABT9J8G8_9RHOB|nr:YHS domain-containing (seleno)protein [Paracoccus sp. 2205BS29-5]MDP5305929.1 YHS domain-containing (seleno)protein [Paracoccus sp. 2205BS29-5]
MKNIVLALLLSLVAVVPAVADDWALDGYDVVSYLRGGQPVPGRSDIATMWKGRQWHFATEENRARFEADPRAYMPGFGGLCPVSLSMGRAQEGDPRHFVIIGKRLYLLRSQLAEQQIMAAPRDVLMRAKRTWIKLRQ